MTDLPFPVFLNGKITKLMLLKIVLQVKMSHFRASTTNISIDSFFMFISVFKYRASYRCCPFKTLHLEIQWRTINKLIGFLIKKFFSVPAVYHAYFSLFILRMNCWQSWQSWNRRA